MSRALVHALGLVVCVSAGAGAQATRCSATATADSTSMSASFTALSLNTQVPNHGQIGGQLNGITVRPTPVFDVSGNAGSSIWMVGTLAKATYHIRFTFRVHSGTGISSVTLHQGQLASSTVLATCTVTNSVADLLLAWPGGDLSMLAVIGGPYWSDFVSITVVPTATKV